MNDRIRELAEQATEDILGVKILNKDRFAELIVQECCQALNPMLRDMVSRGQGVEAIKKHFGVAE